MMTFRYYLALLVDRRLGQPESMHLVLKMTLVFLSKSPVPLEIIVVDAPVPAFPL